MTYQTQKGLDFSVDLRQGKFSHSFQILLPGPNDLFGYMLGYIIDLIAKKIAFTQLEFQVMLLKTFEHNTQGSQMLLLRFGKDNHITQLE